MNDFNSEIKELKTIFEKNCDQETKVKQEKFLLNNFPFYGILTSKRKPLVKPYLSEWNKKYPNFTDKKALFTALYHQPQREFKYSAIEFLNLWWQKTLTFNDLDWLLALIRIDIWWETVDNVDDIFGQILFNHNDQTVARAYINKLISDQDDWVKRIAIQLQLNFKEKMDIDLIFTLVQPLLTTTNFYLIRSIGWTLRNAKRVASEKVESFIITNNISNKIIAVINEH
ncbi:DNA alkylation repair protein [Spiroplasma chrysopicola]|uniref:Putative DNA alkylation repair enzyme n=1 Tax=Spiroplasma chrysopicola DF-1 TaxID=1276227 RepID=R4UJ77_9MOLU|nr:DNA alkylation repair protein [Spiroplasma chrysopicola]AGM25371.1 putative DNA alkylation repair enzyme [Spiroplasma chrysopicola DF-1]